MNLKAKHIGLIALAIAGLFIAAAGIRLKATNPQSSGTMYTWIGVAITFIASFLLSASRRSKN